MTHHPVYSSGMMQILTQPFTARNLTAWFVSVPPAKETPNYTVLEEIMQNQAGLLHETGNVNELLIEWGLVMEEQDKLGKSIGVDATCQESPSSLQLSYEKKETVAALEEYLASLEAAPSPEVSGVVWAINGKLSHADIY